MFKRSIIAPVLLVTGLSVEAAALERVDRSEMRPHQIYQFETTGRTYRAEVVDAETGECLVSASRDGQSFGEPRKTFLLGATKGPNGGVTFVLMGEIKVGLSIEMAVDDYAKKNRFLTPEVRQISLVSAADEPAATGPAAQGAVQ